MGPFPDNNHEEADTFVICLGVSATERNSRDAEMTFFSPDTDVLVLIITSYDLLPKNTLISMVSCVQQIKPLWTAPKPEKAKALPAFHAFSGADNTGRFARRGKATWFKLFLESDDDVIRALCMLFDDTDVTKDFLQSTLARFVCTAYSPKGLQISSIPDLRWHLFCKYMAESEKLPPTMGALKQHILRTHVQARLPIPSRFRWTHCRMAITRTTMMASSAQPPLMCHHHRRLSLRWAGVSARGTAHLIAARANQITYLAQISACATHIVKTTKTHTTRIVIQMMTVMNNVICLIYLNV